jgi:hypothetical protein
MLIFVETRDFLCPEEKGLKKVALRAIFSTECRLFAHGTNDIVFLL